MKTITELDKPSLLNSSELFAKINIAIADSDHKIAQLIKKILSTLGCNRIFIVYDGQDVIRLMNEERIDIIITEWSLKSLSGIDMAIHIRQSLDSPNRMIPIIMLTTHSERPDIQTARDAGISEYLVKPFSAKTLLERLYAVVEEPRNFIMCKTYVGPDRRRVSSFTLPPDPDVNRVYFERRPPMVVPKEQLKELVFDDTPRMVMPDYTLKKKIGIEVPSELLINPMTVATSQEEIQKAQDEFVRTIMRDVDALQTSYQILITSPDNADMLVRSIRDAAESIKSRAGIFGYIRATEVASQLYNFCRRYYNRNNKYHLIILEKHIQTLAVIFANKVIGDGGEIGAELMRDLARLIQKYINRKD